MTLTELGDIDGARSERSRTISSGIISACSEPMQTFRYAAGARPNCVTSGEVWTQVKSTGWTFPLLLLAFGIVGGLIYLSARMLPEAKTLLAAALLLGAGFGSFFDGILLHRILQWHAMLSSVIVPDDLVAAKANMFWDGIFHLFSWLTAAAGVLLLIRGLPETPPPLLRVVLAGGAIAGWGYFNLVEGLIDHQVLGVHHVAILAKTTRPRPRRKPATV
jgi:uncharacterized membrane protein